MFADWLWISCAALLGLIVGSFLNVVIHRLPRVLMRRWRDEAREYFDALAPDDSAQLPGRPNPGSKPEPNTAPGPEPKPPEPAIYHIHWPPSHCPHCHKRLRAIENIPLLSYLLQRGRCRGCAARISPRYPAIELLSAGSAVWVVALHGTHIHALALLAVTWTLIAAATIDYEHYLLPDSLTLPLLWAGLLWSALAPPAALNHPTPGAAILGASLGYLSLWLIYHAHHAVTGRVGMGYGDFKLTGALGAWLGWQLLPWLVLGAATAGLVLALALALRCRELTQAMPFGPMLATSGWVLLVFGEPLGF